MQFVLRDDEVNTLAGTQWEIPETGSILILSSTRLFSQSINSDSNIFTNLSTLRDKNDKETRETFALISKPRTKTSGYKVAKAIVSPPKPHPTSRWRTTLRIPCEVSQNLRSNLTDSLWRGNTETNPCQQVVEGSESRCCVRGGCSELESGSTSSAAFSSPEEPPPLLPPSQTSHDTHL